MPQRGIATCCSPRFFGFIQAFLPMPLKTQSNQIARSASLSNHSIIFGDRVSISLRVHAQIVQYCITPIDYSPY